MYGHRTYDLIGNVCRVTWEYNSGDSGSPQALDHQQLLAVEGSKKWALTSNRAECGKGIKMRQKNTPQTVMTLSMNESEAPPRGSLRGHKDVRNQDQAGNEDKRTAGTGHCCSQKRRPPNHAPVESPVFCTVSLWAPFLYCNWNVRHSVEKIETEAPSHC